MYRSQYDTDITTFSTAGRLLQIEYAVEAVNQGTCVVGLRGNNFSVVCSQKRAQSKLAYHQQKLFNIDDHMACGISGLTADGRVLVDHMRNECLNNKYVYDCPMTVGRLITQMGTKAQKNTMHYGKRPFGVALLVAGYDKGGPHIYESCPSGNYFEFHANAIGARSQSARTYLEKNYESFKEFPEAEEKDKLIEHAVRALYSTTKDDTDLTMENLTVMVVGKGCKAHELTMTENQTVLDKVKDSEAAANADGDDAMEVDQ